MYKEAEQARDEALRAVEAMKQEVNDKRTASAASSKVADTSSKSASERQREMVLQLMEGLGSLAKNPSLFASSLEAGGSSGMSAAGGKAAVAPPKPMAAPLTRCKHAVGEIIISGCRAPGASDAWQASLGHDMLPPAHRGWDSASIGGDIMNPPASCVQDLVYCPVVAAGSLIRLRARFWRQESRSDAASSSPADATRNTWNR